MESEWQLEPLLASRVQKARQLLAEDEEYQGDSGLKVLEARRRRRVGGMHPAGTCL